MFSFDAPPLGLLWVTSVLVVGCAGEIAAPLVEPEGAADGVVIELIGNEFLQGDVMVEGGTTVRWVNRSGAHTVTPDGHGQWQRQVLSAANQAFEHTFTTPGKFDYYCEPHAGHGMRGVIRVR